MFLISAETLASIWRSRDLGFFIVMRYLRGRAGQKDKIIESPMKILGQIVMKQGNKVR